MNRIPRISKFGILSVVIFMVSSLTGRVLYPFGDEPDFTSRAPQLLESEHLFWSPYSIFSEIFSRLSYEASCLITATPFSL